MMLYPKYDFFPQAQHDEQSRENFCATLAIKLAKDLRPNLKSLYDHKIQDNLKTKLGKEPNPIEIAKEMKQQIESRIWYRLRTDNQDRMYSISNDIIEKQSRKIAEMTKKNSGSLGSLKLNPRISIPYYQRIAVHRKPGGYNLENFPEDVSSGAQYDRTISVHNMGSQGINNDDPGKSIATWIKKNYPKLKPKNILDMGCTIGNNTLPYKEIFPNARVYGIDVSRPCIRYAHARACALNYDINFQQENAEKTSFKNESFNLIVSRILLHETSTKALKRIISECYRLLKPGGMMIHCDAPQFDTLTNYEASLRYWDATCNNEPFMLKIYNLSLNKIYSDANFPEENFFQKFIPGIYIKENRIDKNATPGFSQNYFISGSKKN